MKLVKLGDDLLCLITRESAHAEADNITVEIIHYTRLLAYYTVIHIYCDLFFNFKHCVPVCIVVVITAILIAIFVSVNIVIAVIVIVNILLVIILIFIIVLVIIVITCFYHYTLC